MSKQLEGPAGPAAGSAPKSATRAHCTGIIARVKGEVCPADFWPRSVEKLKPTGRQWSDAVCPFHPDTHPSLRVNMATGAFKCMSCGANGGDIVAFRAKLDRCSQSEAAYQIASEFGLLPARVLNAASRGNAPRRPVPNNPSDNGRAFPTAAAAFAHIARRVGGSVAGSWTYRHADGSESFIVARFNLPDGDKTFRPVHRTAAGYVEGDPPGKLPLYNLGEVLANKGRVYIVEGEKCVEAALSIGLLATTSAHGSKAADKTDWSPLAGRAVVILPDNDGTGRDYAKAVTSILAKLDPPALVRMLDLRNLWHDLPEGGDLADYIEFRASADSDDLRRGIEELADKAPFAEPKRPGPILVCLSDVVPEPIRWLWPQRIPLGKVTLIAGDPGLGKSALTLDMAARVSAGLRWPDGMECLGAGGVVLVSAEDDPSDTIRPRLDAMKADPSRVTLLQAVLVPDQRDGTRRIPFSLAETLDALEGAIDATAQCKLVIVDPVSAYMGRTETHVNADVRGVLAPLADLAARRGVAVVCVTHLRKGDGAAMYRAMGSLAFVAASRSVWAVARDKTDPTGQRRLMLSVKQNLAGGVAGLAYTLEPQSNGAIRVAWDPNPVTVTVDEALEVDRLDHGEGGAVEEATRWLADTLADGPVPAKEAKAKAREAGIAPRTLDRAKARLGVVAGPEGFQGGWSWRLPLGTAGPTERQVWPENANSQGLAHSEEVGALSPGDRPELDLPEVPSVGGDLSPELRLYARPTDSGSPEFREHLARVRRAEAQRGER